jgi:branched-chain amino acid transport system ATP-binding protein
LLSVETLEAGYGKVRVLDQVVMQVRTGEAVALLGPNGAGKTTLLRAISGLLPWSGGDVHFAGNSLRGLSARETVRLGIAHVIENHRIFTQQTVADNLRLAGYDLSRAERELRIEEALSYFPEIAEKRHDKGASLSGGQQQMLAVAQGLVQRPRLLLLDEPSAGLSPVLVDRVLNVVRQLKKNGTAVLLVEQLVDKALAACDRAYALSQGRIVLTAVASELGLSQRIEQAYFGAKTPAL